MNADEQSASNKSQQKYNKMKWIEIEQNKQTNQTIHVKAKKMVLFFRHKYRVVCVCLCERVFLSALYVWDRCDIRSYPFHQIRNQVHLLFHYIWTSHRCANTDLPPFHWQNSLKCQDHYLCTYALVSISSFRRLYVYCTECGEILSWPQTKDFWLELVESFNGRDNSLASHSLAQQWPTKRTIILFILTHTD